MDRFRPDGLYKILRQGEFAEFQSTGRFAGSPDDIRDGFIHLSRGDQVAGTLAKHFAGEPDLVVLELGLDATDASLKWEPSRGGQLFPHLYRAITTDDINEMIETPPPL